MTLATFYERLSFIESQHRIAGGWATTCTYCKKDLWSNLSHDECVVKFTEEIECQPTE